MRKEERSTAPRPEHFDPNIYNDRGERVQKLTGRPSKVRLADIPEAIRLMDAVLKAKGELTAFLRARGLMSKAAQTRMVKEIRNGWRPVK